MCTIKQQKYRQQNISKLKIEADWSLLLCFQGFSLNFTDFSTSGKSSGQDCLAMEMPPVGAKWNDMPCTSVSICFTCKFSKPNYLYMRGLCETKNTHTIFKIGTLAQAGTRHIKLVLF